MENKNIFSDEQIMLMFSDSKTKETAFRIIVKQFGPQLYSRIRTIVGTHDETDDILQNTFIKAWRALGNFKLNASLYTWLFRIATNESLSYIRSNRKNNSVSISDEEIQITLPSNNMESSETGEEIAQKLQSAVDMLPERQREVFCMKYYQEMKYDDMAEILHTSVGALKASYHHAVKKIENYLENSSSDN